MDESSQDTAFINPTLCHPFCNPTTTTMTTQVLAENSNPCSSGLFMSSSSSKMMKKMTTTTTKKQATTLSIPPDMDRIAATEFMMISAAERELAYDELHGVFTKNDNLPEDGEENMGTTTTRQAFEETQDLIESSLVLLKMELERIPIRRKRVYLKAIFLKPSLETDVAFQLMFLRADRFNVPLAAQRMCSFFEEKQNLFGEHKLVHRLTLDDLSQEDIDSMCNGSGHVMPQKDRSGRLVFFADPFFLESKDYRSINRMVWYMTMVALEEDEEVQKKGVVEVFYGNGAVGKWMNLTEHTTKGLSALMALPNRIYFCYDNVLLKPIVQLAQMAFGATNRLRFRSHCGSEMEVQYELRSYGLVIPTELFDRDRTFKAALDDL